MHVWYLGYGSNLLRKRFDCYINGGQFEWGGSNAKRCTDKTPPVDDKPLIINHAMYFANNSSKWQGGGVAFIATERDEGARTYARMWKVTEDQFSQIWQQEGRGWYDKKMELGTHEDGAPIWTITSGVNLPPTRPSDNYVRTIAAGLKEAYSLSDVKISRYLIEMPGVKGELKESDIVRICQSVQGR